jgi:hypothetical protein
MILCEQAAKRLRAGIPVWQVRDWCMRNLFSYGASESPAGDFFSWFDKLVDDYCDEEVLRKEAVEWPTAQEDAYNLMIWEHHSLLETKRKAKEKRLETKRKPDEEMRDFERVTIMHDTECLVAPCVIRDEDGWMIEESAYRVQIRRRV